MEHYARELSTRFEELNVVAPGREVALLAVATAGPKRFEASALSS